MAIPDNYIDKFTKDGESRMISPAADKVRVENEHYEGDNLDDVLDEIDEKVSQAGTGNYTKPSTGIPKSDMESAVQTSLGKADSAVQGIQINGGLILPKVHNNVDIFVPTKNSQLQNDSGYITEDDLPEGVECDTQMSSSSVKPVQNKVIKAYVDNLIAGLIDGAPAALDTLKELATALGNNSDAIATIVNTLSSKANASEVAGIIEDNVSVEQPANPDGTFIIHVGVTDYTINLNHTHEGMVKLEKFVESNPPASMTDDKIYVQVDSLTTPQEIEALYLFGIEFVGGVPAGTPAITKPSGTSINLGENSGSGVSKTIEIKTNSHITGDLTVGLAANSDLSFDTTNLPSGVTYNSGAGTLTIAQTTAMQGVNITIVYSGSGTAEIDGGLIITGGGASAKSVDIVVTSAPISLTAIKLTGSQWLKTDYKPKTTTEFEMVMKFSNRNTNNGIGIVILSTDVYNNYIFRLNVGPNMSNLSVWFGNSTSQYTSYGSQAIENLTQLEMEADQNVISYSISGGKGVLGFAGKTHDTTLQAVDMPTELMIGYGRGTNAGTDLPFQTYELTIYRLTITEGGTTVRNYVPATLNGVPGLYDTITGGFISSETSTPVVAIE